uniref:Retrotransposon Gag domain, retroviral aspartyl protease n=1 Tax=Tanacetum cinerariifolium TaxID=118510 RepID=A0A6L2N8G1_TANCI|nr:retrotransposon Gag domain, retroviral aspartyl protease [Tanacetum cinerariifolium]
MMQTQNSDNNNPPNSIATQLAAIRAKVEAIETMKEDIATLEKGKRSGSKGSKNFEGKVLGGVDSSIGPINSAELTSPDDNWKGIRSKRDKSDQNQAKTGSVAKPGKV